MRTQLIPAIAGMSYLGSGRDEPGWVADANAPDPLQQQLRSQFNLQLDWRHVLHPASGPDPVTAQGHYLQQLHDRALPLLKKQQPFVLLGGDHTNAMALWRAALQSRNKPESFGLLWIDAHMDCHDFASTPSGHMHGMPLAALLGVGNAIPASLYPGPPHLNARHLFMAGIASFEQAEYKRLAPLNIHLASRDEMHRNGVQKTLQNYFQQLNSQCDTYGISIDLDGLRFADAPAVVTPVHGGLAAAQVCEAIRLFASKEKIVALEIAEYYPSLDVQKRTQPTIAELIGALFA